MKKTAVVLFNLGGPDCLESVQPFLFNLFRDPAIISLPNPFRWLLARLISTKRAPKAQGLYKILGGKSPLLEETNRQAMVLEERLGDNFKVFVCMRYWHPMSSEAVAAVAAWKPDQIVLLPLYPQFSTTTTASSFQDWEKAAQKAGLSVPTVKIDQYPENQGLIDTFCTLAMPHLVKARAFGPPRLLFSAHSIPKRLVDKGDPYQQQIERTAAAILDRLPEKPAEWVVCYQSKIGPVEWLGPATQDEVRRAGNDGVPVVVLPLAFVSEHVETLIELDIDYRDEAVECGVPFYGRVLTPGTFPQFIGGLANEVGNATLAF